MDKNSSVATLNKTPIITVIILVLGGKETSSAMYWGIMNHKNKKGCEQVYLEYRFLLNRCDLRAVGIGSELEQSICMSYPFSE